MTPSGGCRGSGGAGGAGLVRRKSSSSSASTKLTSGGDSGSVEPGPATEPASAPSARAATAAIAARRGPAERRRAGRDGIVTRRDGLSAAVSRITSVAKRTSFSNARQPSHVSRCRSRSSSSNGESSPSSLSDAHSRAREQTPPSVGEFLPAIPLSDEGGARRLEQIERHSAGLLPRKSRTSGRRKALTQPTASSRGIPFRTGGPSGPRRFQPSTEGSRPRENTTHTCLGRTRLRHPGGVVEVSHVRRDERRLENHLLCLRSTPLRSDVSGLLELFATLERIPTGCIVVLGDRTQRRRLRAAYLGHAVLAPNNARLRATRMERTARGRVDR
jgi:hypothetical protein